MTFQAKGLLRRGDFSLNFDLCFPAGQTSVLLGANGSGKSSLIRVLAGLEGLTQGQIQLEQDLFCDPDKKINVAPQARHLGIMFQEPRLFPALTLLENIAFGAISRGHPRKEALAQAESWLEKVGLEEARNLAVTSLSGGQAQAAALARCLASEPRALLLDEPLAALDQEKRPAFRRLLGLCFSSFSGPRVLITHDPVTALTLGQQIHVLENGQVISEGTASDLLQHPKTKLGAAMGGLNLLTGVLQSGDNLWHIAGLSPCSWTLALPQPALSADQEVYASFSPKAVVLSLNKPQTSQRNVLPCEVRSLEMDQDRVRVQLEGPFFLTAEITRSACRELDLKAGSRVFASIKATEIQVVQK